MGLWQIGCWGAVILVGGLFIYLLIWGIIQSRKEKNFIAELMRRNGWQNIENPKADVKEWVKTELKSDPERYTVFGQVHEWDYGSSIGRDSLSFNQIWNKQEGNKSYFILDVRDVYWKPGGRRGSFPQFNFMIIGMRAPQMSLPFFTLFPKLKFPKYFGWRYAISETHKLLLNNRFDEKVVKFNESMDDFTNNRLKLPSVIPEETPKIDPPITFDSRPFNDRFELYGKETERLRQFFDNEKLTAFESLPQTFVDGGGELVFVYIPEHKPKVEDFENYMNNGIAIINTVCREPNFVGNIV